MGGGFPFGPASLGCALGSARLSARGIEYQKHSWVVGFVLFDDGIVVVLVRADLEACDVGSLRGALDGGSFPIMVLDG
jgi:hypothetical protein